MSHEETAATGTTTPLRVTIFNEFLHERENETVAGIYPDGIHKTLQRVLEASLPVEVETATLRAEQHGLSQEVVSATDVMLWWGHKAHGEVSDEVWDRVMRVNLTGTMLMCRAAIRLMLDAGGGSIVNVTSEAALRGSAAGAAYTASKHAVVGLTRSTLHDAHGPFGTAEQVLTVRMR